MSEDETKGNSRRRGHSNSKSARLAVVAVCAIALLILVCGANTGYAQRSKASGSVRPVTIPVTLRLKADDAPKIALAATDLTVHENGNLQQILSLRSTERLPIALAILIQEDVVSSINNEISPLGDYIRNLPEGSRVLIGYMGAGSLRVRQRWITNTERAASSLRIPLGTASAAPFNPYVQIREGLRRFESIPAGRRAMLVITDGLDISRGVSSSSPSQSIDLDRAIREAQRRSVAVYSFYAPTLGGTANAGGLLVSNAQGSLERLTDDTGGRAFFQGTGAPVSFAPYLRDLTQALNNQYALTYLSTNPGKNFNRIEVRTQLPEVKLEYPRGYSR